MIFNVKNVMIIGLGFTTALFSCKKEDSNAGVGGVSDGDKIVGLKTDTFSITSYTTIFDSVVSNGVSRNHIGAINTTEFGTSSANLFASFSPVDDTVDFPTGATLDSIYLSIDINNVYGKKVIQNFEVYTLDSTINTSDDHKYYSNESIPYTTKVGTFSLNNDASSNISLKLEDSFGNSLLSATDDIFESEANLLKHLNGLAIISLNSNLNVDEGRLYSITYDDIKLKLSYHMGGDAFTKTFNIESKHHLFNSYSKNFSGGAVNPFLNDSTLGQDKVFVQGLAGTRVNIEFPHIREWFNTGNKVITQAQLILPYNSPNDAEYGKIDSMSIFKIVNGIESEIAKPSGSTDFLGEYNTSNNSFDFSITYDVNNGYLQTQDDYKYILDIWGYGVRPYQFTLNGTNPSSGDPAKLIIYYSEY